jgi:hypothetical protein
MEVAVSAPVRPRPGHRPQHRDSPPRQHPTLRPWGVVLIWAALLAVLVATGAGFGNSVPVLEISGSSVALVLLLAAVVWLDRRLRPARWYFRQPTRIGGVVMLAVSAALAWLGFAFGAWLMMIAAVPFIAAVGLEISARRHRKAMEAAAGVRDGPYPAAPAAGSRPPGDGGPAPGYRQRELLPGRTR